MPYQAIFSMIQRENWDADRDSDRLRHHEIGFCAGAVFGLIPMGKINDDSREEAGFGDAEQQPQSVKLRDRPEITQQRRAEQTSGGRDQAPGDHDAGDPFASAPAFYNQAAWDIEQEIAEEENAPAEANYGIAEVEVFLHPGVSQRRRWRDRDTPAGR